MRNILRFERDDWLSDCIRVDAFNFNSRGEFSFNNLCSFESVFVTAKIAPDSREIALLESLGFYRVNRQITLSANVKELNVKEISVHNDNLYRFEIQEELLEGNIFAGTFAFDRFSSDKRLPSSWSIKIKQRWLANKGFGKLFLVVYIDSKVAGFILFGLSTICTIELVSVLKEFRGLGVGRGLLDSLYVLCLQNKVYEILVGTQNDNEASLALYKKAGFRKRSEKLVYHYCKGLNFND